jgi:hypothetical protein
LNHLTFVSFCEKRSTTWQNPECGREVSLDALRWMSFAPETKFPELASLPLVDRLHPAAVNTEAASGPYPSRVVNVVQVGPDRVVTRKPFRLLSILRATSNTLCPSSRLVSSRPSSCVSGRERSTENCSGFLTNTPANTEFWKYVKSFKSLRLIRPSC